MCSAYTNVLMRCRVTDIYGNMAYSKSAVLNVKGPEIKTEPEDVEAKAGTVVTYAIEAEGNQLAYQWQYKYPNGGWTNWGGMTTSTLSFTMQAAYNDLLIRCEVKDIGGLVAYSREAVVDLFESPQIWIEYQENYYDDVVSVIDHSSFKLVGKYGNRQSAGWEVSQDGENFSTLYEDYLSNQVDCVANASAGGKILFYRAYIKDNTGENQYSNIIKIVILDEDEVSIIN